MFLISIYVFSLLLFYSSRSYFSQSILGSLLRFLMSLRPTFFCIYLACIKQGFSLLSFIGFLIWHLEQLIFLCLSFNVCSAATLTLPFLISLQFFSLLSSFPMVLFLLKNGSFHFYSWIVSKLSEGWGYFCFTFFENVALVTAVIISCRKKLSWIPNPTSFFRLCFLWKRITYFRQISIHNLEVLFDHKFFNF